MRGCEKRVARRLGRAPAVTVMKELVWAGRHVARACFPTRARGAVQRQTAPPPQPRHGGQPACVRLANAAYAPFPEIHTHFAATASLGTRCMYVQYIHRLHGAHGALHFSTLLVVDQQIGTGQKCAKRVTCQL